MTVKKQLPKKKYFAVMPPEKYYTKKYKGHILKTYQFDLLNPISFFYYNLKSLSLENELVTN